MLKAYPFIFNEMIHYGDANERANNYLIDIKLFTHIIFLYIVRYRTWLSDKGQSSIYKLKGLYSSLLLKSYAAR
jgi:hypothetical protein